MPKVIKWLMAFAAAAMAAVAGDAWRRAQAAADAGPEPPTTMLPLPPPSEVFEHLRTARIRPVSFALRSGASSPPAPEPPRCACSPTRYTFRLDFGARCDDGGAESSLADDDPAIRDSVCLHSSVGGDGGGGGGGGAPPAPGSAQFAPAIVTSVALIEFNGENNIINQNSTYFDTSLNDGNVITYPSISDKLDVSKPLEDQLELLPDGIMLILFGRNKDGVAIQNTVILSYNVTHCDSTPFDSSNDGSSFGWAVLEDHEPPKAAFCNAASYPPSTSPAVVVDPGSVPTTLRPSEAPAEPLPLDAPLTTEGPSDAPARTSSPLVSSPMSSPSGSPIVPGSPTRSPTTFEPTEPSIVVESSEAIIQPTAPSATKSGKASKSGKSTKSAKGGKLAKSKKSGKVAKSKKSGKVAKGEASLSMGDEVTEFSTGKVELI